MKFSIDKIHSNILYIINIMCDVAMVDSKELKEPIDIEDIAYQEPFNMFDGELDAAKKVVPIMLTENIDNLDKMNIFLKKSQRENSFKYKKTTLLYAYRLYCKENKLEYEKKYEILLQTKSYRSQSGVMVYTLVLSPYPNGQEFSCKYDCKYCPLEPGQPRSYMKEEPGVMRANRYNFDPIMQIRDRALSYICNGHPIDKAEVIVLGGTWNSYPSEYRLEFITKMYYAGNTFYDSDNVTKLRPMLSLEEEMTINEMAPIKIIGLTVETRPDCINIEELRFMRKLGVTRVQMGIQHIDNRMLERINRKCNTKHTINAIRLLKDNCFKVDGHIMPDLPKPLKLDVDSSKKNLTEEDIDWDYNVYEHDREMFNEIITSPDFQMDQWKIYPCSVTPYTELEKEYLKGLHKPYADTLIDGVSKLHDLITEVKQKVPYYIRLNRIVRDIPKMHIIGGVKDVSFRQTLDRILKKKNIQCRCIRCREIKKQSISSDNAQLFIQKYDASEGVEFFLSYETPDQKTLFGFLRLRIMCHAGLQINLTTQTQKSVFSELEDCALIRELHVYGQTTPVKASIEGEKNVQHIGFGTKLLNHAFDIAKENKYKKIAVISGNGVKNYYRKFGFEDGENFLIKKLD